MFLRETKPTRQELFNALQMAGVQSPPIDLNPIDVVSSKCIYLAVQGSIDAGECTMERFIFFFTSGQTVNMALHMAKAEQTARLRAAQ